MIILWQAEDLLIETVKSGQFVSLFAATIVNCTLVVTCACAQADV